VNFTRYDGKNCPSVWVKLEMKNEFYPQFWLILTMGLVTQIG
jgi:hypothetical protein